MRRQCCVGGSWSDTTHSDGLQQNQGKLHYKDPGGGGSSDLRKGLEPGVEGCQYPLYVSLLSPCDRWEMATPPVHITCS